MSEPQPKKASEVLADALALWGPDGQHWCRESRYEGYVDDGHTTREHQGYLRARALVGVALGIARKIVDSDLFAWNDYPETTFPEVKAAVCTALKQALDEEAEESDGATV